MDAMSLRDFEGTTEIIDLNLEDNTQPEIIDSKESKPNPSEFKLEIEDGDSVRSYVLHEESYSIGRNPQLSIFIRNRFVSIHHATLKKIPSPLTYSGYTYQLIDGDNNGRNSTNGVYVNGKRIHKYKLAHGDLISFGTNVKIKFSEIITCRNSKEYVEPSSIISSDGSILHCILDPIATIDLEGKIIEFNSSFERTFRFFKEDAYNKKLSNLVFVSPWKEELERTIARFAVTRDSSLVGRWNDVRVRRSDGKSFNSETSICCIERDQNTSFVVSFRDITSRKIVEAQLRHQAYQDTLTSLGNRRYFLERLEEEAYKYKHCQSSGFTIFYLDLNRFKSINDTFGHDTGDKLLCNVANRIKSCFRGNDCMARMGGDEFTILIEDIHDLESIACIASRLVSKLSEPFEIDNHTILVKPSVGIVSSQKGYDNANEILRDADFAMYQAKVSNRESYVLFDKKMGAQARQRLQLEKDLKLGLERQEFHLHYQPIVSLESNDIIGFEALARWKHSELGWVSPMDFIPIAEESGYIIAIGKWILNEACRQLKLWQDRYDAAKKMSVSVNLSSRQIVYPHIVDDVKSILLKTGLSPKNLKLEITESLLMENFEDAKFKLSKLQELGIQIYIDDFGTGYSSFGYLHSLPIDALKIDRSFINKVDQNNSGLKIIQSIISLAQVFGLEVIAEGVENLEQLQQLRNMQCHKVQGYYISKPMDALSAEETFWPSISSQTTKT